MARIVTSQYIWVIAFSRTLLNSIPSSGGIHWNDIALGRFLIPADPRVDTWLLLARKNRATFK